MLNYTLLIFQIKSFQQYIIFFLELSMNLFTVLLSVFFECQFFMDIIFELMEVI